MTGVSLLRLGMVRHESMMPDESGGKIFRKSPERGSIVCPHYR